MNAGTIKNRIKKVGLDPDDFCIINEPSSYYISYIDFGVGDNERQNMTGDEVNAKVAADQEILKQVAEVTGGGFCGWFVSVFKNPTS